MASTMKFSQLAMAAITVIIVSCSASDHIVGNSIWSIPPSDDFYTNWSNNITFLVGDFLVFRFDTGLSDVTQVSRIEYESCSADNPFRRVLIGPAKMSLNEQGMVYFICTFGNYCRLGQKLQVAVQLSP